MAIFIFLESVEKVEKSRMFWLEIRPFSHNFKKPVKITVSIKQQHKTMKAIIKMFLSNQCISAYFNAFLPV